MLYLSLERRRNVLKILEVKKEALGALKGKWGLAVLATFVFFLMNMVVPMIIQIPFGGFNAEESSISANIVNLIVSLILIPFSFAFYWFYLSLARLDTPEISDLFSVYADAKNALKLIGATILVGIFIFLWSLLFVIPGIIKGLAYSQYYFVLRDHPEYSITEAITESRKLMDGYKWKYFLLNLSFIGWSILAILTLGIGFLWLIPYISTSLATFYNKRSQAQAQ